MSSDGERIEQEGPFADKIEYGEDTILYPMLISPDDFGLNDQTKWLAAECKRLLDRLTEAEAELARIREGADGGPADPLVAPTPGQVWHRLLRLSAADRAGQLQKIIEDAQAVEGCFVMDHKGRLLDAEARLREAERLCRERLNLRGIESGLVDWILLPLSGVPSSTSEETT